jgi:hypothetical protein
MRMLLGLVVCAALCGCGSFQNNSSKTVTVSGQSIGGGSDTKNVSCNGTATLTVKWSGSAGTLSVLVANGSTTVHDVAYQAIATEQTATATFPAATYDLVVGRTSDWKGGYTVSIACP